MNSPYFLNFATPFEILDDGLERKVGLRFTEFERAQIVGIFGKARLDRVVDQFRHGSIRFGRLEAQGPVDLRVEVNRCPFGGFAHTSILALKRFNVKALPGNARPRVVSVGNRDKIAALQTTNRGRTRRPT